ncbi:MAG: hypothetical protein HLUCCX14_05200 [Marinobacter excellens HL-55]|uniref:Uncharacterized protein n=1 Tax=Marinobacter excellens HL-55 TaxID=1305731 RepID=A0A0N8KL05_9GAMM|nr:MAG: hypothetical protein HLUCCX14_05200 [Marinobacter excellens HL-55]
MRLRLLLLLQDDDFRADKKKQIQWICFFSNLVGGEGIEPPTLAL